VLDPAMDPPLTSCNLFVVLCEGTLYSSWDLNIACLISINELTQF